MDTPTEDDLQHDKLVGKVVGALWLRGGGNGSVPCSGPIRRYPQGAAGAGPSGSGALVTRIGRRHPACRGQW